MYPLVESLKLKDGVHPESGISPEQDESFNGRIVPKRP